MTDPSFVRRTIAPPTAGDLAALSARELVALTSRGEASCVDVLEAFLRRIEAVDPLVHAICTLDADAARFTARELDARPDRASLPLLGLPVVVKDNKHARGLRTTFGSPIYADVVADADGVDVGALREAGAIVVGKANIPELGVGGRTHNPLFGSTFNPLDLDKSPAGSSGGNAAAVAARMTPVTLGSDFGGSIRHPAAFCGLYGLRPTPGLVPQSPGAASWDPFVVTGPIGHDPADLALMLDAIVPTRLDDARDPLSRLQRVALDGRSLSTASSYAAACADGAEADRASMADLRVLWCGDAGLPFEAGIVAACAAAMDRFADSGARVEFAPPATFGAAVEVYDVLRHWNFFLNLGPTVEANAERVSDFIRWDVDEGARQPAARLRWAWQEQARLYRALSSLLADGRTVLALPTSQVMPFDATKARIESIDGVSMPWYYSWQASCCIVTVTTLPAISIPLPVAPGELPIGLQLVGPPHGERLLLAIAESMRVR